MWGVVLTCTSSNCGTQNKKCPDCGKPLKEVTKLKIAISSKDKNLDGIVSEVFGRCPYFLIVETDGKRILKTEAIENASANQAGATGISAAQAMAEKGVNAIIAGNIGPRALEVFRQFGIETFQGKGLAKDALGKFLDSKLPKFQ
ncbi:MAG: NifB/NifX family molybdenum-iron cluster-binding protein [Candidatus Diapherotrites archaeon]